LAEQALEGVILSVQGIINEAQDRMREHQLVQLKNYFTPQGEPVVERFNLGGGRTLEVPRYSFVPRNYLAIDEVEMRCMVPASAVAAKAFREAAAVSVTGKRPGFFRRLFARLGSRKRREMVEVKVVFKGGDRETINRGDRNG
jgi:hypothetical protein